MENKFEILLGFSWFWNFEVIYLVLGVVATCWYSGVLPRGPPVDSWTLDT